MTADVTVRHHPQASRFEARIGDERSGFAEYQLTDELYVFTHTEVDPAHEGKGVGSALARTALDHVRDEGTRRVLPVCPFIESWMARNPRYADLHYRAPRSTATD
ncbi:GNAT family N-acetyltransferase [Janibacter sp. DB-40]|uniref:GNAT family N-acetyltransferase n=1 Tax=Janibacter sp. DB-40 TaxID=3028808 RepID=UPI0024053C98|nr:GNAT family N-acetyltransferase [Janibacter sp. DB-40]